MRGVSDDTCARNMARADRIWQLRDKGVPDKQIADIVGMKQQYIAKTLRTYPRDYRKPTDLVRLTREVEAAKNELRRQIELAKFEMPTAPLYRPGPDKDAG